MAEFQIINSTEKWSD